MASHEDSRCSSPDPLALSNENFPTPSPIKTKNPIITPRKPLANASGNKQVQDFYITTPPARRAGGSPSKSTNRVASTSPWRIRLTLQTEQVAKAIPQNPRKRSSNKYLTEHTTTFTVPLKGGDDTPPPATRRGRGRPRKSLESPRRRGGTPNPRANGRRKTIWAGFNTQNDSSDLVESTPPKKSRGRTRDGRNPDAKSSRTAASSQEVSTLVDDGVLSVTSVKRPSRTRSRGRRKEITPMKIAIDSDVPHEYDSSRLDEGVPLSSTGSPDQQSEQDPLRLSMSSETKVLPLKGPIFGDRWPHFNPSESVSNTTHEELQEKAQIDPTNGHQEYDTILESEGFSMVSVSSLASTSIQSGASAERGHGIIDEKYTPSVASPPSLPPALQDDSFKSSVRRLDGQQDGTPKLARVIRAGIALQGILSPKNRSQRLSSPCHERRIGSPVCRSSGGTTQQDELSLNSGAQSPKERLDHLFGGFGPGTRRELRAGLRLGEELARRQRQAHERPSSGLKADEQVFDHTISPKYPQLPAFGSEPSFSLKVPSTENTVDRVQYHPLPRNQLPTPERSDSEVEEDVIRSPAASSMRSELQQGSLVLEIAGNDAVGYKTSNVNHMLEREAEWQREREAISRQIEMANKSQVIVINSDDEDGAFGRHDDESSIQNEDQTKTNEEESSDIWQAEAHSVNSSQDVTHEASNVAPQQELIKPRRSKLPKSWRRQSQIIYSDEIESSEVDPSQQPSHLETSSEVLEKWDENAFEKRSIQDGTPTELSKIQEQMSGQTYDQCDDSTGALIASQLNSVKIYDDDTTGKVPTMPPSSPSSPLADTSRSSVYQAEHSSQQQIRAPSMPATPENKYEDESSVMPEDYTTSFSDDDESTAQIPQSTADEGFAAIDPFLLRPQKQTLLGDIGIQKPKAGPRPPLNLATQSWFSYLTGPISRLINPLPPHAKKSDLRLSSPYEPICQLTPWEPCHTRALAPLYYSALIYPSFIFPFIPSSPTALFLGHTATTSLGWKRKVNKLDCAVADAFMVLLKDRGFAMGDPGETWITEKQVILRIVKLWRNMCMRGEIEVDESKGEKIGLRKQRDRKWKKSDTFWELNQVEYFERKRREFDGLPSWKAKGIKWPQ